jgi:putative CocE/NonD family hydrolase
VDIFLPKKLEPGKKIPTILYLTRYVRSVQIKWFLRWLKNNVPGQVKEDEVIYFTSRGYAVVIVDARGSGASTGARMMDFTPEEMEDTRTVIDWVVEQPWSNGNIGTTGISYVGTTSEMLLMLKHPAIKAAIPRSSIFDLYSDLSFPGGIRQGPFVRVWGQTTAALDRSDFKYFGGKTKALVKGTNPVKGEKAMLKKALEDHKGNHEVYKDVLRIEYRDELHPRLNQSIDRFSVHSYINEISESNTPIYRIGGWYDGALAGSVIKGLLNTPNTQKVLIGSWDHGPDFFVSPFQEQYKIDFKVYDEMLRFFDFHLKGIDNGIDQEPKIYYYTVGKEKWDTTSVWPPHNVVYEEVFFNTQLELVNTSNQLEESSIKYNVDYSALTGGGSRWNSLTGAYRYEPYTNYKDRKEQCEKLLSFTSPTLSRPLTITGQVVLDLFLTVDTTDAAIFVYLEDVSPDGKVDYITEGQFRAIHRKISENPLYLEIGPSHSYHQKDALPVVAGEEMNLQFSLLPVSYQLPAGHRLQISIGGADVDHFDLLQCLPKVFEISTKSKIYLPVVDNK